jgi:tRNA-specific 2-thiouridylase
MIKKRVIVAMSGGVDSSVAALLLAKQGYDVIGITLRLSTIDQPDTLNNKRSCCSIEDIEDARKVCNTIGAPHYVINAEDAFQKHVIDYFVKEYQTGRTPHPCIACNDKIKFDFLLQRAIALDANAIATGHYARKITNTDGTHHLFRSVDPSKDQSYVLFGLNQSQLSHLMFPVGNLEKSEIRKLAHEANLHNAEKPDSQDICFIPQGNYREFLMKRIQPNPGNILDLDGNILGQHAGIEFYTIGQRKNLGLNSSLPLYVLSINPSKKEIIVGPETALLDTSFEISNVNWISEFSPKKPFESLVKIRYKSKETPAIITPRKKGALIRFLEPQKAITPGQAAVFYMGDEILGGGLIDGMVTNNPLKRDYLIESKQS